MIRTGQEGLSAEKIKNVNVATRGKVGQLTARIGRDGQQLVYELENLTDDPTQKQLDVRRRFKYCCDRAADLDENDVMSWKNRVKGKANTYQGKIVQLAQRAYYRDKSSFNLIRGIKVLKIEPDQAKFGFTFDVPGEFIIRHRKKRNGSWKNYNFTLHRVTVEEGTFSLTKLTPETEYMVRIIQPRTPIQTREERRLGTVGGQPVPTHIKGESGDYYFRTTAFSWSRRNT